MREEVEYLLDPRNRRHNLFPIIHQDLYDIYIKHRSTFWIPEEIILNKDIYDWTMILTEDERKYIKLILAFFSCSDIIVNENLSIDVDEITVMEYKFFIDNKIDRENIHTIMYGRLLNTYIVDDEERNKLFNAIENFKTIRDKIEWFKKYNNSSFAHRVVSCAITEGIFFSGSFCSIFWLRKRGLMPGLCDSNDLISREEAMHHEVACYIYNNYVTNRLPDIEIRSMIEAAVDIEIEFIRYILPKNLIGMNFESMSNYIKYEANRLAITLINKKIYDVTLPFEWASLSSQFGKSNFFEHKPTQYAKYIAEEDIRLTDDY